MKNLILSKTVSQTWLKALLGLVSGVTIGANEHCYLGLSNTVPTLNASGEITNFTEPAVAIAGAAAANGYRRAEISAKISQTYMSHEAGDTAKKTYIRRIGNADEISLHEAVVMSDVDAASGADWGTIYAIGFFTAEAGGAPYAIGELEAAVEVTTHTKFIMRDGCLEIMLPYGDGEATQSGT